jgi:hypothetical protein
MYKRPRRQNDAETPNNERGKSVMAGISEQLVRFSFTPYARSVTAFRSAGTKGIGLGPHIVSWVFDWIREQ